MMNLNSYHGSLPSRKFPFVPMDSRGIHLLVNDDTSFITRPKFLKHLHLHTVSEANFIASVSVDPKDKPWRHILCIHKTENCKKYSPSSVTNFRPQALS